MMIKKEIIDQVREQSDIVQVISEFLQLKKAGKYYRALCPFHAEKSPSFYVSPERQIYHCFGCGAGGSVVTFLMQYEKLSFPDAIKKLAAKLNITIETDRTYNRHQPLLDAIEFATKLYESLLANSQAAMEYLKKRAISSETIKRFRLGFAPSGNILLGNAKKQGISEDVLIKAGLVTKKDDGLHDWFFNRIIFPVFSLSGNVIAFGARVLDDTKEPKYLNSPETPIFKKSENLYGLFQAKNYFYQNIPILVEGNFDVLSLVDKGINNVIAPLGTSFTQEQSLLLRRYSQQVIIAFDGDTSGRAATLRTIEIFLKANIDPQIIMLPDGFDPDKYIKIYGKEGFEKLIKNTIDFIDYLVKTKDITSIANQQLCLKEIIRLISLIDNNMNQELYVNKTSEIFKITKELLLKQLIKNLPENRAISDNKGKTQTETLKFNEAQILPIIIADREYAIIAKNELPAVCYSTPQIQEIVQILYDKADSDDYSIAKIIDEIENPDLKHLLADLSFRDKVIPTKKEFQHKLRLIKSKWFYNEMKNAKNKNDKLLLEKLSLEHYKLKKKLSQNRSVK